MDKDVWDILDKNNYTCTSVKVMTDLFGFISSLFKVIGFLPMVQLYRFFNEYPHETLAIFKSLTKDNN